MSEDGIRKMFYNWDEERQNLIQMQKCQRNWDYKRFDMSKSIYQITHKGTLVKYLLSRDRKIKQLQKQIDVLKNDLNIWTQINK